MSRPAALLAEFTFTKSSLFGILIGSVLSRAVYLRYLHPLANFPGPLLATIVDFDIRGLWMHFSGQGHVKNYEFFKKYGPVVRMRANILIVNDPKAIPIVYYRTPEKLEASKLTEIFELLTRSEHAVIEKGTKSHSQMSATENLNFHLGTRLSKWMSVLDERFADTGVTFDYREWAHLLANDLVTDITPGKDTGASTQVDNAQGIQKSSQPTSAVKYILLLPRIVVDVFAWPLRDFTIPIMGNATPVWKLSLRENGGVGIRHQAKISKEPNSLNKDAQSEDKGGSSISDGQTNVNPIRLVAAVSNTTDDVSIPLLQNVLGDSRVYRNLLEDIDSSTAYPFFIPTLPSLRPNGPLSYLHACIKETIRYSITSRFNTRVVPNGGYEIYGRHIPGGARVLMNPWVVSRDKAVYGEDADDFKPERWTRASSDQVRELEKCIIVWGYGDCMGGREGHRAGGDL
ncbi:cytochrome P450 [Choiromyces venosus 120613-1]|uniref:Cytochrome P450 n=1 Tax=Choiromyces venosus 120613-1 TaxID=1336337 RepID=A0A3N4K891_9PEZI|nr:cytochrome P450 [Choiromyces venosus 120613-1]RPB05569.1 cytochrome P450 [Choiromyces venosus 120613-1]